MILQILLGVALAQASTALPSPAASSPTPASPPELFDNLFGPNRGQEDSSTEARAGRDDLNLAKVRSGRFVLSETLALYPAGKEWCASPEALFDSLGIASERSGDTLTVTLFEPRRRHQLPLSRLHKSPEGECIALSDASKLAEATMSYDPTDLEVTVESDVPVPALARLEREESRKRRKGPAETVAPSFPSVDNPWRWSSIPTVDVAVTAGFANGRLSGSTVVEGAGDFLKATALWRASVTSDGAIDVSGKLVRIDPDGEMLGPLHARRVELGDVAMPGQPLVGDSGRMRGLIVSTAPEWRADIFDRVVISGPLPVGWHAELSSESRLMAYVDGPDSAGEYRFEDIPLRVGSNRFVIDLYGPHGEHERRVVERQVGSEQFPENETSVAFGLGVPISSEDGSNAPAAAFATLRQGISTRVSTRVDVRHALSGSERSVGTSAFVSMLGGVAGVSLAHRNPGGLAASAIFARRFGGISVNLRAVEFGPVASAWASMEERSLRRSATLEVAGPVAIGGKKVAFAAAISRASEREGAEHLALKAQASVRLGPGFRIDNQFAVDWSNKTEALGAFALDWSRGTTRLRGQIAYRLAPHAAISQVSLTADVPFKGWGLRLGGGYEPETGTAIASAGAARRFGPFDLAIDAGWGKGGPRIGAALRFAFGKVPGRGLELLPPGASRTAMIAPRLTNRSGRPVEGGRFLVANSLRPEATANDGIALLGGISPGRPQTVELQLSSLEDDRMRPRQGGAEVLARQGQIIAVPIALHPTGSIEVRLVRQAGDRQEPLVGVTVTARSPSGDTITAETDFDGFAMFEGVPLSGYVLSASFNGISAEQNIVLSDASADQRCTLLL